MILFCYSVYIGRGWNRLWLWEVNKLRRLELLRKSLLFVLLWDRVESARDSLFWISSFWLWRNRLLTYCIFLSFSYFFFFAISFFIVVISSTIFYFFCLYFRYWSNLDFRTSDYFCLNFYTLCKSATSCLVYLAFLYC